MEQSDEIWRHAENVRRLLEERAVTYHIYADPKGPHRPWALDPIPFFMPSKAWQDVEAGLAERAQLLSLILQDIYGEGVLLKKRLLPWEMVFAHPGFLRPCHPLRFPHAHPLAVYAADLFLAPDGFWHVLADRTQAPSGAGYALENRLALRETLKDLFHEAQVHRLSPFFQTLRENFLALADGRENSIMLLTPGPGNEAFFEHAFLARYLGFTLAEGRDLSVRQGRLRLRSMGSFEEARVLWRRLDDHFCDPLELKPDSLLGVPGLVQVVRASQVTVVNPLGSGIVESAGLLPFLSDIARYFLGKTPALPQVDSWWCGCEKSRRHVLAHLPNLVVKAISPAILEKPVFARLLSEQERQELICRIEKNPHLYVAQEEIFPSLALSWTGEGTEPRPFVLRAFLAAGKKGFTALPGGLGRVAKDPSSPLISGQAGAVSKDVWVLASEPLRPWRLVSSPPKPRPEILPGGMAENFFWLGRYGERAQTLVRTLKVVMREWGAHPSLERPEMKRLLLGLARLSGIEESWSMDLPGENFSFFISPEERIGTIAFDVKSMLKAAHALGSQFSSEPLRTLRLLQAHLQELAKKKTLEEKEMEEQLDDFAKDLCLFLSWVMDAMPRQAGWMFLETGRRLERGILVSLLLEAVFGEAQSADVEASIVQAFCACEEISLPHVSPGEMPAVEPLLHAFLLDGTQPRSLCSCLDALASHLATIETFASGGQEKEAVLEMKRTLLRACPEGLADAALGTLRREGLVALASYFIGQLMRLSQAITWRYFGAPAPRQLG